jgi:hypothetical protein
LISLVLTGFISPGLSQPSSGPFTFNHAFDRLTVHMSLRVRQSWQLGPEYWQIFYYNRNIDPVFGNKKLLGVKAGYYDSAGSLNELVLVH